MTDPGVFTISLDTELAWGTFDRDYDGRYADVYRNTPAVISKLCSLFERYELAATWAFVAHLFEDCDGHADAHPPERRNWLSGAPCSTNVDKDLWYGPELLERVRSCEIPQDVGLHGYSHLPFGKYDRAAAEAEVADAIAAATEVGLDPDSFVFPRNDVAYPDILLAQGFEVYRGVDARWFEQSAVPKPIRMGCRYLDEAAQWAPRAVKPVLENNIAKVPGSQILRPDTGVWRRPPAESQVERAWKGLDRAAETGNVFHLWFHPFNLCHDPDGMLGKVERILEYAWKLQKRGRIDICSLRDVGRMTGPGKRYGSPGPSAVAHTADRP